MITLRSVLLLAALSIAGCAPGGGIDFGGRPGPDVPKELGPLTNLPDHLKDGSHE